MNIRLKHRYRGALTNEKWIEAGQYDSKDPALFGLAEYLVQNDHAVVIGGTLPALKVAVDMAQGDDVTVETEVTIAEPVEGELTLETEVTIAEPDSLSPVEPEDDKPKKSGRKK